MTNIVPSHMMDKKLLPFETIQATGQADAESCATPAPASVIRLMRDDG